MEAKTCHDGYVSWYLKKEKSSRSPPRADLSIQYLPHDTYTNMATHLISARLQVLFWTIIIRLISDSRLAQRCLQQLYQLKDAKTDSVIKVSLVCLAVGILLGYLLGLVGI